MNATCERFNRTVPELIQGQFVDFYEDLLFTDLVLLNKKPARLALAGQILSATATQRTGITNPNPVHYNNNHKVQFVADSYRGLT